MVIFFYYLAINLIWGFDNPINLSPKPCYPGPVLKYFIACYAFLLLERFFIFVWIAINDIFDMLIKFSYILIL